MTDTDVLPLGEDLLRGVPEIAAFIGQPKRKTYYLLNRGTLPAGKEGALWVSSRAALRAHYRRLVAYEGF